MCHSSSPNLSRVYFIQCSKSVNPIQLNKLPPFHLFILYQKVKILQGTINSEKCFDKRRVCAHPRSPLIGRCKCRPHYVYVQYKYEAKFDVNCLLLTVIHLCTEVLYRAFNCSAFLVIHRRFFSSFFESVI